jgi:hypothetical protein
MNFTVMTKRERLERERERGVGGEDSDIQADATQVSVYRVYWTSELAPDRERDKI